MNLPGVISSHGFGAIDGLVKNADLAAGRTTIMKQRAAWLEGGALVLGLLLVAIGDSALGEGLLHSAEAIIAERGGMAAGQRITGSGPGRLEMPQLIDASVSPLPMAGGGYSLPPNPMGGTSMSSVYPAQREAAGLLG